MICSKYRLALGTCLFSLFFASSAMCEESPKRSATFEARRPSPRIEADTPAAHEFVSLRLGLRLPKFLAFGTWSASSSNPRGTANVPRPTECRDHCTGSEVPTDRSRATVSAILAGVGAAGVVTGVVLTLTKPRASERTGLAPDFRVKLSGQRAIAAATWRF